MGNSFFVSSCIFLCVLCRCGSTFSSDAVGKSVRSELCLGDSIIVVRDNNKSYIGFTLNVECYLLPLNFAIFTFFHILISEQVVKIESWLFCEIANIWFCKFAVRWHFTYLDSVLRTSHWRLFTDFFSVSLQFTTVYHSWKTGRVGPVWLTRRLCNKKLWYLSSDLLPWRRSWVSVSQSRHFSTYCSRSLHSCMAAPPSQTAQPGWSTSPARWGSAWWCRRCPPPPQPCCPPGRVSSRSAMHRSCSPTLGGARVHYQTSSCQNRK